jgi:hypothetical protein
VSDISAIVSGRRVLFARSATKHRVSKERILHVIAHCGLVFEEPVPPEAVAMDDRLLCLGDDPDGNRLEVMAVEGSKGS